MPDSKRPSVTLDEKPYGKCQDCGIDLADRAAVSVHGRETLAPTSQPGVTARGHRVRIVNPTEEEQRARWISTRISDALDSAYEDLYESVERGKCTAAEISAEMWKFDLRDGWDDYVSGAEDD